MFQISIKHSALTALMGFACAACSLPVLAQDNTQFIPIVGYRVGQFASVGSGFYSGMVDYFTMINERDGGVNWSPKIRRPPALRNGRSPKRSSCSKR